MGAGTAKLLGALARAMSADSAQAQTARDVAFARLDGYVQGLTDAGRFSGVVLIAKGDRIVFEHAYGSIDPAREAPVTRDTRLNLASAGKMFTGVAILQLVAGGALTLDTPVGDILPNFPNAPFREQVTVRHLLTHITGAGDIALFGVENAADRAKACDHAAMIALVGDRSPQFPPGSKQEYGNFGHVVFARMIEVVSGESFEAYLARHIFAPAGMTKTGFVDCPERAPDLAVGYTMVGDKQVSNCVTIPARGFGAGGEVSTARDLLAFVTALRTGQLIPPALYAEATRTHHRFIGLGLFATGYGEGVAKREFRRGHGGDADGINTDIHYPETDETVIVLANRDAPVAHQIANFELALGEAAD